MTNDERLELLWTHYQRQIDENRAVYWSLEELREQVTDLRWRMNEVCNHLSLKMLGE